MESSKMSTSSKNWRAFVAGGIAGCAAKTCVAPIDRVKILFQTDAPRFRHMQGSLSGAHAAAKHIYVTHGVRGLFQGHLATMLRIFPYAAIKYTAFEQFSRIITPTKESKTPAKHFTIGALAGITAIFFTYPLELIRVRSAFNTDGVSLLRVTLGIGSEKANVPTIGRVSNYFRGFMPTLYGVIPYAGTTFLVYEEAKQELLKHSRNEKAIPLFAGALAGAVAQTATYPLEIVRRHIQVQKKHQPYHGNNCHSPGYFTASWVPRFFCRIVTGVYKNDSYDNDQFLDL